MRRRRFRAAPMPVRRWMALAVACLASVACGHGDQSTGAPTAPSTPQNGSTNTPAQPTVPTWNVATQGIPKFVTANYIDLTQLDSTGKPLIYAVSKYRSSVGHAYGDRDEPCASKKHYFMIPNSSTKIYAPFTGTVVHRNAGPSVEAANDNLEISPDGYPAFYVTIFHVLLYKDYKMGDRITAGEWIGHHTTKPTYSDIAVAYDDGGAAPATTYVVAAKALVSYFDVLADSVFKKFQDRGIASRADVQITSTERATWPLKCIVGSDAFDALGGWFPDKLPTTVPLRAPTSR